MHISQHAAPIVTKSIQIMSTSDNFKWFGEGFDGFPKTLPDDTVVYIIDLIDAKLGDAQVRSQLALLQKHAAEITKKHLKDYIWQREPFKLELERHESMWRLRGSTNYGDSVADEWVIVWLLRELSKKFSSAWIRVFDSDGEFLLIEAANTLPRWLDPEIAENRIWLNAGRLMIIPRDATSTKRGQPNKANVWKLSLQEAREYICTNQVKMINSPMIEEEAFFRTRNFPAAIMDNLHHALITIPRRLAYILHRNPSYIAPATEAFYLRDPIALMPLKKKTADGLKLPPEDLVTVSVRFTKVIYAQLRGQEFENPQFWNTAMNDARQDERAFARLETGMKVTCGFEMALADPSNKDKAVVREINLLLDDINSGEERMPSDVDIEKWDKREDDEGWLDINLEDLENELQGKSSTKANGKTTGPGGFGDKAAQEDLQKLVSRFEAFLNSEKGEKAEYLDDDGEDSDEGQFSDSESGESDSENDGDGDEDKVASFDDEDFQQAMREIMGLPPEQRADAAPDVLRRAVREIEEYDESDEEAASTLR